MPQSDTITLESLYTAIAAQIAKGAGTFNLVPDVCSSDAIGKFYADIIPGGVFTIANGTLTPAAWDNSLTQFTLNGTSSAFQTGDTDIVMVFSDTPAGVLSNMT